MRVIEIRDRLIVQMAKRPDSFEATAAHITFLYDLHKILEFSGAGNK